MNNSIDLGKIYGIDGCPPEGCVPTGVIHPSIPSLEQIAAYNLASAQQGTPAQQGGLSAQGMPVDSDNIPITPATMYDNQPAPAGKNPPEPGGSAESIMDYSSAYPVTSESIQYLNGFMRTQIGRRVSIDFLVGNDNLVTKTGYLLGLGANYVLINEIGTKSITACDFYNLKFITFIY